MREDWIEVQVGEISQLLRGISYKKHQALNIESVDYLPILRANNINQSLNFDDLVYVPKSLVNEDQYIQKGDIIIAMSSGSKHLVGKSAQAKSDFSGSYGAFCALLRPNQLVSSEYISYFFHSTFFRKRISEIAKGTNINNLKRDHIIDFRIPLAPVLEQRAIVSKIDQLLSELDNGTENLNKAKEKLEIYRQAVLKKAFEGELTKEWRKENPYDMNLFIEELKQEKMNAIKDKLISKSEYFPEFGKEKLTYNTPSNWVDLPWKTIASNSKYSMKRGPFGSALKKEYFVDNGIVVYEQGHAINDDPYRHRYFISEEKFEEMKAFEVKGGDMIISCSGVTLGRICLLPDDADVGVINQALLKIDLDERIILKKFFLLLFRSETFQRLIFEKSLGTAMPNMVGMTELKEIPIPIPSIEEQRVIISEIESRLSVCDNILINIGEGLEKSEALRHSILKKAFEGKLLTKEELEQCRKESDWEPAEKLLERIKEMK